MNKSQLPSASQALPGRDNPMPVPPAHAVLQRPMTPPFPDDCAEIQLGMGCFWGAERLFWQMEGVWVTAVGYGGGHTPNPTYEEVCSGQTGHAELVRVIYRPEQLPLERLLQAFWENHDPTQGMRQGNDLGTQYRSCIFHTHPAQAEPVEASRSRYQQALDAAGRGRITTEIGPAGPFYYAEAYHQQYLARNPQGYCGLGGTGICLPPESGPD